LPSYDVASHSVTAATPLWVIFTALPEAADPDGPGRLHGHGACSTKASA
jgi:hypothetical protein